MPKRDRPSCPICIEDIAPSRVCVCPFCEYTTCKSCLSRFLLSTADDPNCMNCHRTFDRDVLIDMLTQKFVNQDLKKHREAVLLERETAMMPSTQPYVNQELQRRKNTEVYAEMQAERRALKRRIFELDRACWELQQQSTPPLEQDKRQFVHRCAQDGCRGFLSTAWKCNICNHYTCSDCNAPRSTEREDDHVCNEDDRVTMQMLKNDCKKCPGCAQYIHKVSGCDQMWCTACHTAFSWRTGLKINGNIHNPHFYEFQRQNRTLNREAGDIPCGGMPTQREMIIAMRNARINETIGGFFNSVHRLTVHIEHVNLPVYAVHEINERSNVDLRVRFMLNELTSDSFKEKIQQREKRNQKMRDIHMLLQMFVNTMADLLRQVVLDNDFAQKEVLIRALVEYSNTHLRRISVKYACVVPNINVESMRVDRARH